jgi:branched-chain amino acid transport system permease protein
MTLLVHLLIGAVVTLALYSFVAVGFSLIFSVSGMFHFAHASIYPLAGYVCYSVSKPAGLAVGIVAGVAAAAACALVVERLVYQRMRSRRATAETLMISSLGLQILLQGMIGSIWGTEPLYVHNPLPRDTLSAGAFAITPLDLATIAVAAVVVTAALVLLVRTRRGAALMAVAEEPVMASVVGISTRQMRLLAMGAGTAIAAPAAIVAGARTGLTPDMGAVPLLFAFAAVIVGGVGSVRGTVVGLALLLGVAALATYEIPSYWTQGIAFLILLGFMLWRPRGLMGRAQRASAVGV